MKTIGIVVCAVAGMLALGAQTASAAGGCTTKAAVATSMTAAQAKWYALETTVQAVDWGMWPSYVANNSTPGYKITHKNYTCKPDGGQFTCHVVATFCKM